LTAVAGERDLISGRIQLNEINEGFAALKSAAPVRQLIDFGA
jgi:Zn-dependent alcohol dehydrogenase